MLRRLQGLPALSSLLFVLAATGAEAAAPVCTRVLVAESPYLISRVHSSGSDIFRMSGAEPSSDGSPVQVTDVKAGAKASTTDKKTVLLSEPIFRDPTGASQNYRILARGALVRPESSGGAAPDLAADRLIQVRVLAQKSANQPKYLVSQGKVGAAVYAEQGEKGYVWAKALRPMEAADVLVLKEDAKLFSFSSGSAGAPASASLGAGSALSASMENGKYRALSCGSKRIYLYRKVKDDGVVATEDLAIETAGFCSAQTMNRGDYARYRALQKLLETIVVADRSTGRLPELEMNEWGMARIPENVEGLPLLHYHGGDPADSDTWGDPDSICALMKLAADWKSECSATRAQGCEMQIGDMGFVTPAFVEGTEHDPLGHRFHSSGKCVDMRPFRLDGQHERVNLAEDRTPYDEALTRRFVEFIQRHGATPVYFNDSKLTPAGGQCDLTDYTHDIGKTILPCPGHDDHIHFCLEKDRAGGC